MKTRLIFAAMLLMAFVTARAQEKPIPSPNGDGSKVNTLVVNGSGTVWLKQGDNLMLNDYGNSSVKYRVEDSVLYLEGTGTREITIQNLKYLVVSGAVGVRSKNMLRGENLSINTRGAGEVSLEVGYDNIYVGAFGARNVTLLGDCNVFCGEGNSLGRLNVTNLNYKAKIEKSGDKWNMAFNLADAADRELLQKMVTTAQPFFEVESNRSKNQLNGNKGSSGVDMFSVDDLSELDELMREYNDNLQRVYDSIDWKRIDEDIRRANQEFQRVYDSLDWESIEAQMRRAEAEMEKWGRRMEQWGKHMEDKYSRNHEHHYEYNDCPPKPKKDGSKDKRPEKKNLLLDAHWNGFQAGLNLLSDAPGEMDIRPLRCWYFGFNIADVGIAFDRRHIVGLFTGVGIGWNNFSWNNPVTLEYDPEAAAYIVEPIEPGLVVKNTKHGVLYLEMPLMFEVRPTRSMYIDAGVTGGLRIAQWNRVKCEDGHQTKYYYGSPINRFKLDASLRVGGNYIGFFANYALLPMFDLADTKVHPVSFGFSINF